MFKSYIIRVANNLVKEHNTRDPFEIASLLGVNVKYGNLVKLKGFYCCISGSRYIAINQNMSIAEAALICAHELGHDQIHRDIMPAIKFMKDEMLFSTSKVEHEADLFAASLLIPDDLLSKYNNSGYTIKQIAANENLYPQLIKLKWKHVI